MSLFNRIKQSAGSFLAIKGNMGIMGTMAADGTIETFATHVDQEIIAAAQTQAAMQAVAISFAAGILAGAMMAMITYGIVAAVSIFKSLV